jgi:N-acetylglucosaminyldiphosphoundecaprenol N-acetyl-beta-D-mannosaminyltransferase
VSPSERIMVLGCPVDRLTIPEILEWIASAVERKRPSAIAVVNANKLHQMARDPELRSIVSTAELIIPEWAMVWAARRLKLPPLIHSGGLPVARAFLPFAEERGLRPFFLGAKQEVIDALGARLRRDFPRLQIAGMHHGYLNDPAVEASALGEIRRAAPDVLFVAMGSPAQERWIAAHKAELGVPVSMGIGGSFDVLSGAKPDTPSWARGRGLEWLYRLALDPPAYARRYLVTNTWFVTQVLKAKTGLFPS